MSLRNWEAVGALGHSEDFGRCDCLELSEDCSDPTLHFVSRGEQHYNVQG